MLLWNNTPLLERLRALCAGFLLFSLLFTDVQIAFADTSLFPKQINYQAKLTDASNVAIADGTYNVAFRLYTTPASATTTNIWEELHNTNPTRIQVTNGLLSVMLGQVTSLANINWNQTLYLGVEIGGTSTTPTWDGEMTPRKQLGATPAAFVADTLDGLDSQQFVRTDATSTIATSSANTLLTLNQQGSGNLLQLQSSGTAQVTVTNNGNLGVGTTSPYAKLSVAGTIVGQNIIATSTTASSTLQGTSVTSLAIGSLGGILKATGGYVTGGATTDDLTEGSTNLYYTILRGAALIAGTTTDALIEGAANRYFTDPRARLAVTGLLVSTTSANTWTALQTYTAGLISLASSTIQNFNSASSTITTLLAGNASSTNLFSTNIQGTNAIFTGATSTSVFAANGTITNLNFTNGVSGNATTTNLNVANNLTLSGATTTAANGINIASGCFAIGGVCFTGYSDAQARLAVSGIYPATTSGNTWTQLNTYTNGVISLASSTIQNFNSASSTLGTTLITGNATGTNLALSGQLTVTGLTGVLRALNGQVVGGSNTDNLTEGSTNLYFTDPRARLAVTGLLVSTTSANTWTALQTYTAGLIALASSTIQNFNSASSTITTALIGNSTTTNSAVTNETATNLTFTNATGTSATTSNLNVANNLSLSGATTTALNGIALSAGCFSINGICIPNSASSTALYQSSGNVGAVQFSNGNSLNSDGANFLWDNTSKSLGIGTTSPYAKLSVAGSVVAQDFVATSTTSTSTFAGGVSVRDFNIATSTNTQPKIFWGGESFIFASSTIRNTFIGLSSGTSTLVSGNDNVALGYQSLQANMSGNTNVAVGSYSLLQNTTGSGNTAIGYAAMKNATIGNSNVAVGPQTLLNNRGNENSAFGSNALITNTTGVGNNAFGSQSLWLNQSGVGNQAFGRRALNQNVTGSYNIAIGEDASFSTLSGSSVAIGWRSLFGNTSGASSTALGALSGLTNSTGNNNVYVGDEADALSSGLSNAAAVGSHAKVGSSNSLVLGGTGTFGVNVGIGTTSPYAKLSVAGSVVAQDYTATGTATSTFAAGLSLGGGGLYVTNGGVRVSSIAGAGCDIKADVNGNFYCGTDAGASGSNEINWTYFNNSGIRVSTTSNQVLIGGTATTSLAALEVQGNLVLTGNMGIGTTSPYAKLSVVGQVAAEYFTATSTTATSTFVGNVVMATTTGTRVGIGTVNPLDTLNVYSSVIGGITLMGPNSKSIQVASYDGNSGVDLIRGQTTSNAAISFQNPGASLQYTLGMIGSANNFYLMDSTGAAPYLSVTQASKNFGIATSTPYARTTIWGAGTALSRTLEVVNNASTTLFTILDNGRVGLATSSPATNYGFAIGTTTLLSGNATATGAFNFQGALTSSSTATSTFAGSIQVINGCFREGNATSTCIGRGQSATYVVAASNSKNKQYADYIGTGTGDQAVINSAINAAYTASRGLGGKVYLLEGDYSVNGTTTMATGTQLVGSGPGTVLKLANSSASAAAVIAMMSVSGTLVSDLTIDGNRANQTVLQEGITIRGVSASTTIDRVIIRSMFDNGVSVGAFGETPAGITIRGSEFYNNGSSGVFARTGSRLTVSDSRFSANSQLAASGGVGINGLTQASIIGNTFDNENGAPSIYIVFGSDDTIVGNTVSNFTAGSGINLENTTRVAVVGNTVSSGTGASTAGIYLFNTTNSTVGSNVVQGVTGPGIYLSGTPADNTITGNAVYAAGNGLNSSIEITGSRNIISSNQILGTVAGSVFAIHVNSGSDNVLVGNTYSGPGATSISDTGTNTKYTQWDRMTLDTKQLGQVAYNVFGINASSSSSTMQVLQMGSGPIARFGNATSTLLTLEGNGNVGIGTSSPWAKLSLMGTYASQLAIIDVATTTTSGGATSSIFRVNANSTVSINTVDNTSNAIGISVSGVNYGYLRTAGPSGSGILGVGLRADPNTTNAFLLGSGDVGIVVNGVGYVGIGTTTPGQLLSLTGSMLASTTATSTFQGGGINLITAAGNTGCFAVNGTCLSSTASTTALYQSSGNAGAVQFSNGNSLNSDGTNFFWDNTNKRLGIGTTSPYAKLSVVGQVAAEYFNATSTTATSTIGGNMTFSNTAALFGFGTTSPMSQFTISGNRPNSSDATILTLGSEVMSVYNNGTKILSTGILAGGGTSLEMLGTSNFLVSRITGANSSDLLIRPGGTANAVNIADANGSTINATFLSNGRVGIATSSPATNYGFAVATTTLLGGNATATGQFHFAGAASTTFANGIQLQGGCFRNAAGACVGGGKESTYIVAAHNSPNAAYADYVGDYNNDEVQINQAITAAYQASRGRGGKVYLLDGDFRVATTAGTQYNDAAIVMATGTTLMGAGIGATTITLASTTRGNIDVVTARGYKATTTYNLLLSDFTIDGNATNQTGVPFHSGIGFSTTSTSTIQRVVVKNIIDAGIVVANSYQVTVADSFMASITNGEGITVDSSKYFNVSRNHIQDVTGYGIGIFNTSIIQTSDYVIADNTIINANTTGINAAGNSGSIIGNVVHAGNSIGISYTGGNGVIANNTVTSNLSDGIQLFTASNMSVTGNAISGNSSTGIRLTNSSVENTITGNNIDNNGLDGTSPSITIVSSSVDNLISGNKLINGSSSGAPINIDATSLRTTIAANSYNGYATVIADASANTKYTQWDRLTLDTKQLGQVAYNLLFINASSSTSTINILQMGSGPIARFGVATSTFLTLEGNGYLGVGSSTPSGVLSVNGGTAGAGLGGTPIWLKAQDGGSGTTGGGDIFLTPGASSGTGRRGMVVLGTSGIGLINGVTTTVAISENLPATQPILQFEDSGNDTALLGMTNDNYFAIASENSLDGIQFRVGGSFAGTDYMNNTATVRAMTINSAGNVGIGTTSPYSRLSVWGAGTTATSRALEIMSGASTTLFTILDNGRVGIATSSPATNYGFAIATTTLFQGNATSSGILALLGQLVSTSSATSTFANGLNINSGCFAVNGTCLTSGGGASSGIAGTVQFSNGSSGFNGDATNFFWDNTNKRLGVGTSSPYAKLSVAGTAVVQNIIATSTTAISQVLNRLDIGTSATGIGNAAALNVVSTGSATGIGFRNDTLGEADISYNSSTLGFAIDTFVAGVPITLRPSDPGGSATTMGYFSYTGIGLGTSTPYASTTIWGNGASLGKVLEVVNKASTTLFAVLHNGNVGIGTSSPYARLSVAGETVTGWITATSTTATSSFQEVNFNSAAQTNSINWLFWGGTKFIHASSTGFNTYMGLNSGAQPTATGTHNTAFGEGTLAANLGGLTNSAFGRNALNANTYGSANSAFGNLALLFNATGSQNVAMGRQALQDNTGGSGNTGVGYLALLSNQTGGSNTAVGSAALNVSTSNNNTAIGSNAGAAVTTGGQNTLLGTLADVSSGSLQFAAAIGYGAIVSQSNALVLGGTGNNAVNVGIGTSSPWAKLSIQNTYGSLAQLLDIATSTNSSGSATSSLFTVLANGNVGVGTSSPYAKLSVELDTTSPAFVIGNSGSSSPTMFVGGVNRNGFIGLGTTTNISLARMFIDNTIGQTGSGSTYAVAGLHEMYTFNPTANDTVQVGDRTVILNAPSGTTATNTAIGKLIRVVDNTSISNLVRGMDITANGGSNTWGVNTGLRASGNTFGVQGITTGLAGGTSTPAGLYGENTGTTLGDVLRLYTASMTTATSMVRLVQETSSFSGNGINMEMGLSGGSFTGNFLDLQVNGNSRFKVTSAGTTTIGQTNQTSNAAGLQIGYGGLCVDNDGLCSASTTGRISAVSYTTGSTDLAENYFSTTSLSAGDIVMIAATDTPAYVVRGQMQNAPKILGIVSTKPAIILGSEDGAILPDQYPIALSGRVPVNVNLEHGAIHRGDRITISSVSGVGARAIATSSATVGIALEDWAGDPEVMDTMATGTVLAFVNLKHQDLDQHIVGASIDLTSTSTGEVISVFDLDPLALDVRYIASRPLNFGGQALKNVQALFSASGKWSLDDEGNLIAESVEAKTVKATEKLQVGTPTSRTGVTLYDDLDGSPYCIKMVAGVLQTLAGECGASVSPSLFTSPVPPPASAPPDSSSTPPVPLPEPTPAPTPEVTPPPEDTPPVP